MPLEQLLNFARLFAQKFLVTVLRTTARYDWQALLSDYRFLEPIINFIFKKT